MTAFSDYYKILMEYYNGNTPDYTDNSIPNYYTQTYEQWGGVMWWELLEEGLISTYPKKVVETYLRKIGATDVAYENTVPYQNHKTNTLVAQFPLPIDKTFIENLNKGLYVYGWKVAGKIVNMIKNGIITIEPIFPAEYTPKITNNFYHITNKKVLNKIEKVGLVPRDTETLFHHPGNRIYLIQVGKTSTLKMVAEQLSQGRWNVEEDTAYINVDVTGLKLYEDPMFRSKTGIFKACFTFQNIHPAKLTVIVN